MSTRRDVHRETELTTSTSTPELSSAKRGFWPLLESFRAGDRFVIYADLPGMRADELVVEVSDEEIRLAGERRPEFEDEPRHVVQQERLYGLFERRIPLPEGAKPETLTANLEAGVLTLEVDLDLGDFAERDETARSSRTERPH